MLPARAVRAGESLDDYCRACKLDRRHTVVAANAAGRPIRVVCDYCRSEHNYRGGAIMDATPRTGSAGASDPVPARRHPRGEPFPTVTERERTAPPMNAGATADLELLLRRIIREETGLTSVTPAEKWRGGRLVLQPGAPNLQEKAWPIETFFQKIVMVRNRLRTLEQQVNASDLPADTKIRLQGYITGCYGSLTSFNVLFAAEDDELKGAGGD